MRGAASGSGSGPPKDIQTTRITSQTILGVIFGGLANILSGGIGMATGAGDAGNIVSVAGGALEVLFGTSANFTKVRQEFSHPHNHLAAVWYGSQQSDFFSGRAWRFLTDPGIRDLEGQSLRDVMLQTWREEGRLGEPGSVHEKEREALLFGFGGVYDSEQLHVREAMLQQLESSIQLMHQELETLLREILMRQAVEEVRIVGWASEDRIIADVDPLSAAGGSRSQIAFIDYSNMSNVDQRVAGLLYTMREMASNGG